MIRTAAVQAGIQGASHEHSSRADTPREGLLAEEGWPPEYYLLIDDVAGAAYDLYQPELTGKRRKPILVLDETGTAHEITRLSPTMRALSMGPKVAVNVYLPETVVERARQLLMA